MDTSENVEATIVAVGAACEAGAAFMVTSAVPEPYKSAAAGVLGAVGVMILAFWKAKVNKQKILK